MMTQALLGGASLGNVYLRDDGYSNFGSSAGGITCSITVASNGIVTATNATSYTWLLNGAAADYDILLTPVIGAPSGSSVNTWLSLASNRTWSVTSIGFGLLKQASFDLSIRDHATLVTLVIARVSISATNDYEP